MDAKNELAALLKLIKKNSLIRQKMSLAEKLKKDKTEVILLLDEMTKTKMKYTTLKNELNSELRGLEKRKQKTNEKNLTGSLPILEDTKKESETKKKSNFGINLVIQRKKKELYRTNELLIQITREILLFVEKIEMIESELKKIYGLKD